MAAAKKTAAAKKPGEAKKTRTPLADVKAPVVGVDPRDSSHVPADEDLANRGPTEAQAAEAEAELAKANDAPGVGGLANTKADPPPGPRKRAKLASEEEVEVEPTVKHFQMLDDNQQMHVYPVGTTKMLKEHAEHWYAEAHGVQIKK